MRVGRTVRRPVRPFTATVQAYLAHLRGQGFLDAPEPLGYDAEGREVLSYVDGDVPVEPLPDDATTTEVLVALAGLVRRLHDAAEGWDPPADAVWGAIPGSPPPGVVPLFDRPELVAHQDYCPGNVVFRGGAPAALIDFDLARPTTRVADVVNAVYWWAPLLHPVDRAPSLAEADVAARTRAFADAYGLTAAQRALVVPVAVRRARNATLTMRAAAQADPVFRRWWDEGVKDRLPRAEAWLAAEADRLDAALRYGPSALAEKDAGRRRPAEEARFFSSAGRVSRRSLPHDALRGVGGLRKVFMALRSTKQWWGVVLDAPDARELARFYARLLGWQIFNESAGWADVAPSRDAGYNLAFATEPNYARPVWPTVDGKPQMSMHLDLEVADLEHAVAYAIEVGATLASHQPQETVRVMLDPAGHPFCLYLDNEVEDQPSSWD